MTPCRVPSLFRGFVAAASLKRRRSEPALRPQEILFRGFVAAASLKRGHYVVADHHNALPLPRLCCRGLIEARGTYLLLNPQRRSLPRLCCRGLIEAGRRGTCADRDWRARLRPAARLAALPRLC